MSELRIHTGSFILISANRLLQALCFVRPMASHNPALYPPVPCVVLGHRPPKESDSHSAQPLPKGELTLLGDSLNSGQRKRLAVELDEGEQTSPTGGPGRSLGLLSKQLRSNNSNKSRILAGGFPPWANESASHPQLLQKERVVRTSEDGHISHFNGLRQKRKKIRPRMTRCMVPFPSGKYSVARQEDLGYLFLSHLKRTG